MRSEVNKYVQKKIVKSIVLTLDNWYNALQLYKVCKKITRTYRVDKGIEII